MFFLLQSSIIFAVMASNIAYQWTPNGYLAGIIGVGLAWVSTRLIYSVLIWRKNGIGSERRS
jgi:hypothetical protein